MNLSEIRRRCSSKPLEGESLDKYYCETDESRDPRQNTRQRLWNTLNEGEDLRLLFSGYIGSGKSTELNKFLSEHKDDFFTVKFSAQTEMFLVNIYAEDLLLVMAEQTLKASVEAGLAVDEGLLTPVEKYFSTEEIRKTSTFEAGAHAAVGADTGILERLVGLFARISAEAKFNTRAERTAIASLRKRPSDLLAQVNILFGAVRKALEPKKKRLLIIVEDLDKLGIAQAQDLFVNYHLLLTGVECNVVYTIPIFLFYSPDADSFLPQFNSVVNLRMIQTMTPSGTKTEGFGAVKRIVQARLGEGMVSDEALDLLVENTAGVLRHVFEVLSTAANTVDASIPLNKQDIQYGLDQLTHSLQAQINLPGVPLEDGPRSRDELLERLSRYARLQAEGKKPPPDPDPTAQLLLKSCALVEYNGEGWFGVHPLAKRYLDRLDKLSGDSSR